MNKTLLISALCLTVTCIRAQILSPQVISSTGAYSAVGSYSISYTVGEMSAVETFTGSGGAPILTQGFQQPNDLINGILDVQKDANGTFVVYPIPATDNLWFGYEYDEPGQVIIDLYDMTGRKLDYTLTENYSSGKVTHNFDCSIYASGNYLLVSRFTAQSGQTKLISKKFQVFN